MAALASLCRLAEIIPEFALEECKHTIDHKNISKKDQSTEPSSINLREFNHQSQNYYVEYCKGDSQDFIGFVKSINGDRHQVELPPSTKRKRGRKVKTETVLLMKFTNSKGSMPKKEYIRIKLLRGLRKIIRRYTCKDTKLTGINQVRENSITNIENGAVTSAWLSIVGFYTDHIGEIDRHFNEIDFNGRNKEGNFNNEYCKRVLDSPLVKSLYKLYVRFLFIDLDPDLMCNKFNIMCCRLCHATECIDKWRELEHYLMTSMLAELGMEYGSDLEEEPPRTRPKRELPYEDSYKTELY